MLNRLKMAALSLAFLLVSAFAGYAPSEALITDPNKTIPARTCEASQEVCYERVTINFSDPRISSGVWFATLPSNAYLYAIDAQVNTAFNAGSSNVVTIGATQANANEVVAASGTNASITPGTTGIYHLTSAAGLGTTVTSNTTYQTQINGAVPLYVKYTQTGTAATAGSVTFVLMFIKNDDQ